MMILHLLGFNITVKIYLHHFHISGDVQPFRITGREVIFGT